MLQQLRSCSSAVLGFGKGTASFLSARLHRVHQVNEGIAITALALLMEPFSSQYYRNCLLSVVYVEVV